MIKILLPVLIFNFIYPLRLAAVPHSEFLLYGISLSLSFMCWNAIVKVLSTREMIAVLIGAMILFIFAAFSTIINNTDDHIQYVVVIKYVFAVVLAMVLVASYIHVYRGAAFFELLKAISISGLLVAVTCIMEFFFPSAKLFFGTLIDTSGNIEYLDSFRVHGLATGGGASLSVGLAISSVVSLVLVSKSTKPMSIIWFFAAVVIYLSTLFVGRTGFFILSLFLVCYVLTASPLRMLASLGGAFIILLALLNYLDEEQVNIIYSYSLEPVKNYIEYGSFESKTTNHLASMYYIPEVFNLIFGAGFWRYPPAGFVLSDVGYIKVLLSFGLLGFLVFYIGQFALYFSSFRWYCRRYGSHALFSFIFFVLFIAELKEAFFVQNYAFKVIWLLIAYSVIQRRFRVDVLDRA